MAMLFEAGWHEAREAVHRATVAGPTETVPLTQAHGQVLAVAVTALSDMPPFAASRIDGWAVSGAGPWQVVGDSRAGHTSTVTLQPGQCIHIATGAQLPDGATADRKSTRLNSSHT